jgi:predicted DNA-binding transcriptional regulator AlpA
MDSPRLDGLRAALTAMPPGTLVPRDWVLERLSADIPAVPAAVTPAPPARVDLTIRDLAQLCGTQPSTVPGWVERGDFPGAYKLHGKEWRVPVNAVEAFQDRQRGRAKSQPRLSAWRSIRATRQASGSETGLKPATTRSPRGNAEA